MKLLRNRKGQGTLEYIVIAAAVIALAVILKKTITTSTTARIDDIKNGMAASGPNN